MEIKTYTFEHRNDFKAILECEHCGHEQPLNNGYNDDFYFEHVLPKIACKSCGRSTNEAHDPAVNGVPA